MGEILRAVMTDNAVRRAPVTYCLDLNIAANAATSGPGVFQNKADSYFLLTSLLFLVNPQADDLFSLEGISIQIERPNKAPLFREPANARAMYGDNYSRLYTMPEYVLLEPSELLVVTLTQEVTKATANIYSVGFCGIEYGMK